MKEKIITGTNDRPRNETVAPTGAGIPDDDGSIIDVAGDGTARMRKDLEKGPAQPDPPLGPAVDDEDPDYSPMDRDRDRQDDRSRDDSRR